jgi:hypothetical protein
MRQITSQSRTTSRCGMLRAWRNCVNCSKNLIFAIYFVAAQAVNALDKVIFDA